MKYLASIQDFFKSPKWGMNMLLGAVMTLIPVAGPMVISGWQITGFWSRQTDEDPARFPDFDFQHFSKYLQRGLWPFLVSLVASIALVPVIMVVMFVGMGILGAFASGSSPNQAKGALALVAVLVLVGLYVAFILVMMLIQTPLIIRATITQDFGAAFNLAFVKRFLGLVWWETILAMMFTMLASLGLLIVGVLACFVGIYLTVPVISYVWHHLQKQLYQLYLSRGGEPVPVSPKLSDAPPAVPAV